jgi:hypothetical protein
VSPSLQHCGAKALAKMILSCCWSPMASFRNDLTNVMLPLVPHNRQATCWGPKITFPCSIGGQLRKADLPMTELQTCQQKLGMAPTGTDLSFLGRRHSSRRAGHTAQLEASPAGAHLPNCVRNQWRNSICSEMHKAAISPPLQVPPWEAFPGPLGDNQGLFLEQLCGDIRTFPRVSCQLSLEKKKLNKCNPSNAMLGEASKGTSW